MVNMMKTKACNRPPKTPNNIIGTGTSHATMNASTAMMSSSPKMLQNRRSESDTTRLKWLMISMGNIKGARTGSGPRKCLK